VASKVDSRTILDQGGADKLLGKGDMLFLKPGMEKLIRGQAPYVTDDEINGVVEFWANQAKPDYHPEIASAQEGRGANAEGAGEKDEIFDEAVAVVMETGQASTSNLQRRLRLGYTRAARIIDQMEANGSSDRRRAPNRAKSTWLRARHHRAARRISKAAVIIG
jgi:S-DNA-T family DNA segregation ATPase FtsK/SpoIIIE